MVPVPANQRPPRTSPARQAGHGARATPRRFPARYKLNILLRYQRLDRAGRTALLESENLRASQVSRWRAQARAGALKALDSEPGSQPARPVHASDTLWAAFTEACLLHDPPMRPEQMLRAFMRYHVGLTDHLPPPPAAAAEAGSVSQQPQD